MAYVTEDFVTWHWQRIELEDTGYAPTIVRHRDHFLLTACGAPLEIVAKEAQWCYGLSSIWKASNSRFSSHASC